MVKLDNEELINMKLADVLYDGNNQMIISADKAKEIFMSSFDLFSDDFMIDGRPDEIESMRESL